MQNHRNPEQDRRARAQRRVEKKIAVNNFFRTYAFLSFWMEWGRMILSIALGLALFSIALCVSNAWMLDIIHTNGGVGGFFMIMAIFGGILAAGSLGLIGGEFLAQQIEHRTSDHYIVACVSVCSLGFDITKEEYKEEKDLFDELIEHYLPDTLAEMGPEPQEHICSARPSAPAHAATPIPPTTEAADQRLRLIP